MNKNPEFGFVIICLDHDVKKLNNTLRSIKNVYPNHPCICSYIKNSNKEINAQFKMINGCDFVSKSNTLSGLINSGIKASLMEWNFLIESGKILKSGFYEKYKKFIINEKDILYHSKKRAMFFDECDISGMFFSKSAMGLIGNWIECADQETVRLFWIGNGLEQGFKFKGIVNVSIN